MKRILSLFLVALLLFSPGCAAEALAFSDVTRNDWYFDPVTELTEAGILQGYPDGSFQPMSPISGGEFVAIIARLLGLAPEGGGAHWASGLVNAALSRGLFDYDELPPTGERFDLPISRQVAVKILQNAADPGYSGDYGRWAGQIADLAALDGRYYNAVFAAYERGLVLGDEKGYFHPKEGLTRGEACALITRAMALYGLPSAQSPTTGPEPLPPSAPISGGVSEHGVLSLSGTALVDENGRQVVLRGMSSHGIQWFPQFASPDAIRATRDYGANLFRVAMYTEEGGYLTNPALKDRVIAAVDAAIALDMYVIIDWHILSDGNPLRHQEEAIAFFSAMSAHYAGNPAVLYEICNEPNGNVTWRDHIAPYARAVIPVIRQNSPQALILVGTGTWSQDVDLVTPLEETGILYTFHFYAGTHGEAYRDKVRRALSKGIPVFVSEWGVSDASGSGGVYLEEASRWMSFLREEHLSWANWSLCDKGESSAALLPGAKAADGFQAGELSPSGSFVFSHFSD